MSEFTGTYYFPFYSGSKIMPYRVKGKREIIYTRRIPKPILRQVPKQVIEKVPKQVPKQVIEQVPKQVIEQVQVEYYHLQPSRRLLRDSPRHKKVDHIEQEYPKETICSMS